MYIIETTEAGFLTKQQIQVVRMPRKTFLGIVDGLLSDGYEDLTDQLRPVAETMERFPMGTWIHDVRGCGCVVGEYLVATSEIDRAELAEREHRGNMTITDMLAERENGAALEAFGEEIDERLRSHVRINLAGSPEDRYDEDWDAIEFVD